MAEIPTYKTPIQLGKRYKDTIMGFVGTATARTTFLVRGQDQILLENLCHDKIETIWMHADRLEPFG